MPTTSLSIAPLLVLLAPVAVFAADMPPAAPTALPDHSTRILTPAPGPAPRLTGPRIFGVRPGHPIVHRITATGERPITFTADNLPAGITFDSSSGQLSGMLAQPGEFRVTVRARNARGEDQRVLRLVVGEAIALTPPLGWNSWNSWAEDVDQEKILASARAMVSTGLADHGWSYVNIDDAWQGARGGPRNGILSNAKFPDMKALADEIHALGLKFGIYSTPFITSYAGFVGGTADNPQGDWKVPSKEKAKAQRVSAAPVTK